MVTDRKVATEDGRVWLVPVVVHPNGFEQWPEEHQISEVGTPVLDLGLNGEGFECE